MVKIGIVEDSIGDIIGRYSFLTEEHDVHVLYRDYYSFDSSEFAKNIQNISEEGFDSKKILISMRYPPESSREKRKFRKLGLPTESVEWLPDDLDVYFVDGLQGAWENYTEKYGKERTHIISGDPHVIEKAKYYGCNAKENYHETRPYIERVISQLTESLEK